MSGTSFVLPGESNSTCLSRETKMRGSRGRALSKYPSCCYFLYILSAEDLRVQGCLFLSWPTPRGDKHTPVGRSVGLAGPSLWYITTQPFYSQLERETHVKSPLRLPLSPAKKIEEDERGRGGRAPHRTPSPCAATDGAPFSLSSRIQYKGDAGLHKYLLGLNPYA